MHFYFTFYILLCILFTDKFKSEKKNGPLINHVSYVHKDWCLQHFGSAVVVLMDDLAHLSRLITDFFGAFPGALLLVPNQRGIPAAQLGAASTPLISHRA